MKVLLSRGNEHKSRFIKREECTSESMKEVELQLKKEEGETQKMEETKQKNQCPKAVDTIGGHQKNKEREKPNYPHMRWEFGKPKIGNKIFSLPSAEICQ